MQSIRLKNIKYDEMLVLQKFLEAGVLAGKTDIDDPEFCCVMAVIAELYIKIMKKTLFVDKSKILSLKLTAAQGYSILAYIDRADEIINHFSQIVIVDFRNNIHKQLI